MEYVMKNSLVLARTFVFAMIAAPLVQLIADILWYGNGLIFTGTILRQISYILFVPAVLIAGYQSSAKILGAVALWLCLLGIGGGIAIATLYRIGTVLETGQTGLPLLIEQAFGTTQALDISIFIPGILFPLGHIILAYAFLDDESDHQVLSISFLVIGILLFTGNALEMKVATFTADTLMIVAYSWLAKIKMQPTGRWTQNLSKTTISKYILEARIRKKISRDLHDNIGSSLSSIGVMLNVAIGKMEDSNLRPLLSKIADATQTTQDNLHDIVWNMNSEKRTLSEIVDRMQEFIHEIFEEQSIDLELKITDDIKDLVIKPENRYDLYLIFKELINNAAKYALANRITVGLDVEGGKLRFQYADDGVGFEVEKQTAGNGILNIQARARNLRGAMVLQSAPGNGTNFILRFPIS